MKFELKQVRRALSTGFVFAAAVIPASMAHATGPDCFGGEVQAMNPVTKTMVTKIKDSATWGAPQISCTVIAPGATDQKANESIRVFVEGHGQIVFQSATDAHDCNASAALQKKLDDDGSFEATVRATSYEAWELDYSCQPLKHVGFDCWLGIDSASPTGTFVSGFFEVKSRAECEDLGSKL